MIHYHEYCYEYYYLMWGPTSESNKIIIIHTL